MRGRARGRGRERGSGDGRVSGHGPSRGAGREGRIGSCSQRMQCQGLAGKQGDHVTTREWRLGSTPQRLPLWLLVPKHTGRQAGATPCRVSWAVQASSRRQSPAPKRRPRRHLLRCQERLPPDCPWHWSWCWQCPSHWQSVACGPDVPPRAACHPRATQRRSARHGRATS